MDDKIKCWQDELPKKDIAYNINHITKECPLKRFVDSRHFLYISISCNLINLLTLYI